MQRLAMIARSVQLGCATDDGSSVLDEPRIERGT